MGEKESGEAGKHMNPWEEQEEQPVEQGNPPILNLPAIITFLIVSFALIHLLRGFLPERTDNWWVAFAAFIPARFSDGDMSQLPGGQLALIYSWFSYNFLHGNWQHILFNSLWLVIFGSAVARRISTKSFIFFFLLTSFAGAFAFMVMHWGDYIPVIGASAFVAGLMGAVTRFMFSPVDKDKQRSDNWISDTKVFSVAETFRNRNALFLIVVVMAMNYLEGSGIISLNGGTAQIAWEAHIGGFLAGLFFYGYFERQE